MRPTRLRFTLPPIFVATVAVCALHCGSSTPKPSSAELQPTTTASVTTPATAMIEDAAPPASASASTSASSGVEEKPAEPLHWSYEGKHGPVHWGELSADWSTCKTGTSQSPIDIVPKDLIKAKDLKPLDFSYKSTPLSIFNTGHLVQVSGASTDTLAAAGDSWELVQFHFHSPSEHTVDGKRFDAELHLVHKNGKGAFAVVAVLLQKGKANKVLGDVFDNAPTEVAKEAKPIEGKTIDLTPMLPKGGGAKASYYTYSGSLTAPPCTENVTWFLLATPADVSEAQLAKLKSATHGDTSRPMQPIGTRTVTLFK